jgi:hypothetical protein
LKPEWWGSPLVQEEMYQEKPVRRGNNNNNNNNNNNIRLKIYIDGLLFSVIT